MGLSDITAYCEVGMMLTAIVVHLTKCGESMGEAKAKHSQVAFQKLLAHWWWSHKTEHWEVGNEAAKLKAKATNKRC